LWPQVVLTPLVGPVQVSVALSIKGSSYRITFNGMDIGRSNRQKES